MSKRKGTFRSKIDSILAEGAAEPATDDIEPLRSKVEGILAASGDGDPLARLLKPTTETKLDEIEIVQIKLRPGHREVPRGDTAMDTLKASIAESGIIQPLLLRPAATGGYEVVDGERRLIAARALKLTAVPAVVRALSDAEAAASAPPASERAAAAKGAEPAVAKPAAVRRAAAASAPVAAAKPAGRRGAAQPAAALASAGPAVAAAAATSAPVGAAAKGARAAGGKRSAAKPEAATPAVEAAPATPEIEAEATIVRRPAFGRAAAPARRRVAATPAKPAEPAPWESVPTFGGQPQEDRTVYIPPPAAPVPAAAAAPATPAATAPVPRMPSPAPSAAGAPAFPPPATQPQGGQLAAAAALGADNPAQGYNTFVFYLFLCVLVVATFAFSTIFVYHDQDLGIRALVVGVLGLLGVGFLLVWRRS